MLYPEAQILNRYPSSLYFASSSKAKTDKKTSAVSKAAKGTAASMKIKPSEPGSHGRAKKAVSNSKADGSEDEQSQEQKIDIECVLFHI